jgi:two-component system NtrC family sensor kinase
MDNFLSRIDMKKTYALLLVFFACVTPILAQQVNIDSIVKAVIARNPRKENNLAFNKDSLLKRLPLTLAGPQRVKLVYDIFYTGIYPDTKQNIEAGYQILAWAKSHHDLVTQAVISAELGSLFASNGDKATGQQLELAAMEAATKANDKQALGVVYQNSFNRTDLSPAQWRDMSLKAIILSAAANDIQRVSWEYTNLSTYYTRFKKPDSAFYYHIKALKAAVRANSVYDICLKLVALGNEVKDERIREKYLKGAYAIAELTNDAFSLETANWGLSTFHEKRGDLDSALIYAVRAYQVGKHLTLTFQIEPVEIISQLYIKKRNIDSAVKYINLYYDIKERLLNSSGVVRAQALTFAEKEKQQQQEVQKTAFKNSLYLFVLVIVIAFLFLIAWIFWRNNRQSHKSNALLASQKKQTEIALEDLKAAQVQLIQSAKMASLGELTAGIAHEIQNPLNFVNNFSEVSVELLDELKEEAVAGHTSDVMAIADDLSQNLSKILHHGQRADNIVKSMLQHSRAGTGAKEPTDLNKQIIHYLDLAYHGIRAKDHSFEATLVTTLDPALPLVNVMAQDISRVLLNLYNNAFYAVAQKKNTSIKEYRPELSVTSAYENGMAVITLTDNGVGIPDEIKKKIMQPFFTTKPTGQGTGLGLSLSYDIVVKSHGGSLDVESKAGVYSIFVLKLPIG